MKLLIYLKFENVLLCPEFSGLLYKFTIAKRSVDFYTPLEDCLKVHNPVIIYLSFDTLVISRDIFIQRNISWHC